MKKLIEALTIFSKYYDNPNYKFAAEHDTIYVYPTDRPLTTEDLKRIIELDWIQLNSEDFEYLPAEGWSKYV